MPGIAGIIGAKQGSANKPLLQQMVNRMAHEPFHSCGTFANDVLDLWVGWVCQQDTFADCMPVWNEAHDILLIFSGEEFTQASELHQLSARGHAFDMQTASYLVHMYEESGPAFLDRLNGVFSGLVADFREKRIILFNDRYGLGRVYYHESEGGFYFASEAKSLLKVLPQVRNLSLKGLGEFLSCGCVLQDRTLFQGISLLPPASVWTFCPGQPVRKEVYFRPASWEEQTALSAPEYYEQFRETWRRVLPRYLRGKEVALSLTGGVDSRLVLAWANRSANSLPCYTFASPFRDCADVRISQEVARICQQRHETISLGNGFLSRFSDLAAKAIYVSDGGMDVTGAVDLYLQERARAIAPVRVTGTNGGELLRSLVVFKPNPLPSDLLDPELLSAGREAAETYVQELNGNRVSFTGFKQAAWFMGAKFVLERCSLTLRLPYFDNEIVALVFRAPRDYAETKELSLRLITEGNPALKGVWTDRGESAASNGPVAWARHALQELTYKAEYAYDYGMPQWMAPIDHVLEPMHLERMFLGRHKIHHFRLWYRHELSKYVESILLDGRTRNRSYFRSTNLERLVRRHVAGRGNHTREIHKVLSVELILRHLLERD